nr:ABC transporter ATP-binding protein [Geobacter hydrogenophilus]
MCKTYRGKRQKIVKALSSLDLTIAPGEIFGFLGPNGAGKSTTIKILMGLIQPTGGTAKIFGTPVINSASRQRLGYLPENPSFLDFMTAREYLAFVGRAFSMHKSDVKKETDRVLELLALEGAANRAIRHYSKGMIQRLGLAQVLLHDPDIYILDEPMSGLDPIGRALVKDILRDLKSRGKTVFFSTHITSDVEIICDRVGIIVNGNLMAVDHVQSILQSGIEGYVIQLVRDKMVTEEVFVEKERLKSFISDLSASDVEIERIEPKRKDIEKFFLDIVAKGEYVAVE